MVKFVFLVSFRWTRAKHQRIRKPCEDGPVTGLRTITVKVPASGQVEFRLFKNWSLCLFRGARILRVVAGECSKTSFFCSYLTHKARIRIEHLQGVARIRLEQARTIAQPQSTRSSFLREVHSGPGKLLKESTIKKTSLLRNHSMIIANWYVNWFKNMSIDSTTCMYWYILVYYLQYRKWFTIPCTCIYYSCHRSIPFNINAFDSIHFEFHVLLFVFCVCVGVPCTRTSRE